MSDKKEKILIKESTYKELKDFYDNVYIPTLAKMSAADQKKARETLGDTFEEFVDGFLKQNLDGIKKTNEMMSKFGDMKDMLSTLGLGDISNPEELLKKLGETFPFSTDDTVKKEEPKKSEEKKDLKN